MQDAVPISFSQEISGWRSSLEKDLALMKLAVGPLRELAQYSVRIYLGHEVETSLKVWVVPQVKDAD